MCCVIEIIITLCTAVVLSFKTSKLVHGIGECEIRYKNYFLL